MTFSTDVTFKLHVDASFGIHF